MQFARENVIQFAYLRKEFELVPKDGQLPLPAYRAFW